jgi:hypothetical protein
MVKLNPNYVLAPFHNLIGNCQSNVLMGLRIVEKVDAFPDPTSEELMFFQIQLHAPITDIRQSKTLFKKWILINGFREIHKCLRTTIERMFVFRKIGLKIESDPGIDLRAYELELRREAARLDQPTLIGTVNSLFGEEMQFSSEIESFNKARNCLEHANGIVTERSCNNREKNKLIIHGNKFKAFFKKGTEEVLAEIGKPGPENAALMMGAEKFQIEFSLGQSIELSLKQFLDILNTCVFVGADVELKLKKCSTYNCLVPIL